MRLTILFFLTLILPQLIFSQDHYDRLKMVDVLNYKVEIDLHEENDKIEGWAEVTVLFKEEAEALELDLTSTDGEKGMQVVNIKENGKKVSFAHTDDLLRITPPFSFKQGEKHTFRIHYAGTPADGMIIGKNKHGDRTFFADNWPNRAHNWFPCVDHPSDKATVEFVVDAPRGYKVIGNGTLLEESFLVDGIVRTRWKTDYQIPTKVMVIGAAPFAMEISGFVKDIPISSWVFRQDRINGFKDYALAKDILAFFIEGVGEYPYHKLANVQSKTRYGGMENASCIFYSENSIDGKGTAEGLIAHEIAHQWFGNSASEASWHHIWLSEGFATYWTHLWFEKTQSRAVMDDRMVKDRETIIKYHSTYQAAVVDTFVRNWNKLLNPNSYQKGSWVLHMLRHKIGDEAFFAGIRNYYEKYKFSNALTKNLRIEFEKTSKKDLRLFFHQWIMKAGHPELKVSWKNKKDRVDLTVEQVQVPIQQFPLEMHIYFEGEENPTLQLLQVRGKTMSVSLGVSKKIERIVLDPGVKLLFEEVE